MSCVASARSLVRAFTCGQRVGYDRVGYDRVCYDW